MRLVVLLLALAATAHAAPPAPGSDDAQLMEGHEAWITGQHGPGGQYCCTMADGRPAEVRRAAGGGWEVLYDRAHWTDGTDTWIAVPPNAVLPTPSPFVFPFAWITAGHVWCLALPGVS